MLVGKQTKYGWVHHNKTWFSDEVKHLLKRNVINGSGEN